jgi:hypothetical protein
MKKLFVMLIVLAAFVPVQANLLVNGNFNSPEPGGSLDGWWTSTEDPANETVTLIGPGGGYDGSPYVEMWNATDSYSVRIGQTINVTAGQKIQESGMYADSFWGGAGITLWFYQTPTASGVWDGDVIGWAWYQIYRHTSTEWDVGDNVQGDGTWKSFISQEITAPAGTLCALYKVEQWGWSTTAFDNLVVVPEPATMVMLGLGGLALIRRKRA